MPTEQTRILVFVGAPSHFREMATLAKLLSSCEKIFCNVVFLVKYEGISRHIEELAGDGISWIDGSQLSVSSANFLSKWMQVRLGKLRPMWNRAKKFRPISFLTSRIRTAVYVTVLIPEMLLGRRNALLHAREDNSHWIRYALLNAFLNVWTRSPYLLSGHLRVAHAYCVNLPAFLDQHRVDTIVLPEDNLLAHSQLFVRAVQARRGKALVFPFTIANHMEWASHLGKDPEFRPGWLRRLFLRRLFPTWMISFKGKSIAHPFAYVLLNEALGTAPPQPWVLNSGYADKIVLDSEFFREYCLRAKFPAERLIVLGAAYQDRLYVRERSAEIDRVEMRNELNLKSNQRFVLLSLPPDQFSENQHDGEFASHLDMTNFLVTCLNVSPDFTILISPHPRITEDRLASMSWPNAYIRREPIFDLLPVCELFVACASATVRMAVAASKPVINFDSYRTEYDDFAGIPGLFAVATRREYELIANDLLKNKAMLDAATHQIGEYSMDRYQIDGKAASRIVDFLLSGD